MAVKRERRRRHNPVKALSAEAAEHAASLAPPEERDKTLKGKESNNSGAINVDTGELKLPKGINGDAEEGPGLFGFDPVVLFILCFSLAFIAFIAYLISIGPGG